MCEKVQSQTAYSLIRHETTAKKPAALELARGSLTPILITLPHLFAGIPMPPQPSSTLFPAMEVCVIPSTYSKRLMIALALVGTVAVLAGAYLGLGASHSPAGASPQTRPAGTLGVGSQLLPPISTPVAASNKVVVTESLPLALASLSTVATRTAAPIARPAARKLAGDRGTSSRSAVLSSGWKSARVSWYGPGFYGRHTASGPILTQGMMNVAHKTLPFGTRIQFEYKGRTCVAVVNDRGPFVAGRTFDLGPGTATALGFGGVGTVKYRILGR